MTPGSVPTNSTDIFQEGIRIPAAPGLRAGKVDETLMAVLRLNVRIPDIFMGDLNAEVAACTIAAVRLREATSKFGDNTLLSAFSILLDRAEAMTRAALRRLKPGTYRAVDYLDNDGIDIDTRIRIEVAATIGDGSVHFDLTGPARRCGARSTACPRGASPPPASRCAPSRTRPSPTTAAASGRSR